MIRVIRKYANRKLYDTSHGFYVSLADIAKFVKQGDTVEVRSYPKNKDITAEVLYDAMISLTGKQYPDIALTELIIRDNGLASFFERAGIAGIGGV